MYAVRLGPPLSPAATRQIITSYFLSFRALLIEQLMELIVVNRQDTYASAGIVIHYARYIFPWQVVPKWHIGSRTELFRCSLAWTNQLAHSFPPFLLRMRGICLTYISINKPKNIHIIPVSANDHHFTHPPTPIHPPLVFFPQHPTTRSGRRPILNILLLLGWSACSWCHVYMLSS